jgi:SAM-dependent methyltransferase
MPDDDAVAVAYSEAADPISLREERGQVATAERDLASIEAVAGPAADRALLEVGCWTGSFLLAARERGWAGEGIEPSAWAVGRAKERGLTVEQGMLADARWEPGEFSVVVATDVIEHLLDPSAALAQIATLLDGDGVLFCTVPDTGSRGARALGARWWSVLPMHVQYFTRASLGLLLSRAGFEVSSIVTHPKLFSRQYYVERFGAFVPGVGGAVVAAAARMPRREAHERRLRGTYGRDCAEDRICHSMRTA